MAPLPYTLASPAALRLLQRLLAILLLATTLKSCVSCKQWRNDCRGRERGSDQHERAPQQLIGQVEAERLVSRVELDGAQRIDAARWVDVPALAMVIIRCDTRQPRDGFLTAMPKCVCVYAYVCAFAFVLHVWREHANQCVVCWKIPCVQALRGDSF